MLTSKSDEIDEELIEIAANTMKVSVTEAEKHCKKIPEFDAYYFWNPMRGGTAVIVATNGEKLGTTSSVSYDSHVKAFLQGRRN